MWFRSLIESAVFVAVVLGGMAPQDAVAGGGANFLLQQTRVYIPPRSRSYESCINQCYLLLAQCLRTPPIYGGGAGRPGGCNRVLPNCSGRCVQQFPNGTASPG